MTSTFHIVLAMKPLEGNFAQNALKHGVAGINVDGCRIGTEKVNTHSRGRNTAFPKRPTEKSVEDGGRKTRQDLVDMSDRYGRWPANVIHDGSQEVIDSFPMTTSNDPGITHVKANGWGHSTERRNTGYAGDSGSVARFFKQVKEE